MTENGKPQASCSTCDFMRHEGTVMRCYWEAPVAVLLGNVPSKLAGARPQLVITGLSPEVHPARFCRHHPDLRDPAEVVSPGIGASPARPGIVIEGDTATAH